MENFVRKVPTDRLKGKNPPQKLNFTNAFRPIYYFSRVFGYMPFKFIYDSNGEVQKPRFTAPDILWFLVTFCALLLELNGNRIWNDENTLRNFSNMFTLSTKCYYILETIFCTIALWMDLCNRFKFVDIM